MTQISTNDGWSITDLANVLDTVEIRDAKGKLLGVFVPANLERAEQIRVEAVSQIDWAEIERRKQSNEKGEPFDVVLERLKALDAEINRRKAAGEKTFTREEGLAYFQALREKDSASR
jgi:hypothetical protein